MYGGRVALRESLDSGHEYDNVRDGGSVFQRKHAMRFVHLLGIRDG